MLLWSSDILLFAGRPNLYSNTAGVFDHLSSEFCLWGNIYFLFPALLANDNLIHPGEDSGGDEGGSWRKDEIAKEGRTERSGQGQESKAMLFRGFK